MRYGLADLIEVEPLPDGDIEVRLRNLEYDLTRAIKKVVHGFRSTDELFERIEGPVRLTAIWSPDSLPEMFKEVPDAVRGAVEELGEAAGDRLVFEEMDPSQDPQLAGQVMQRYGAQPLTLGLFDDRQFYLYAILQVGEQIEFLPLVGESLTSATVREMIEQTLRRHAPGFLKTVGLVTSDGPQLPPEIRMQLQMPQQQPPEFEEVKRLFGEEYQVRDVDLSVPRGVPSDVDVLVVLKPKNLDDTQLFSLDQYLMRGGRVVIYAGNYGVDFGPTGLNLTPLSSGLTDWLAHHGVTIGQTLVLDDRNQKLPMPEIRQTAFGMMRTWSYEPYPYLVQVSGEGMKNPEVTAALQAIGIYWGSPVVIDDAALAEGIEVFPLLESSDRSWTSDDLTRVNYVEYEVPAEGTEPQLLAVALSGRFTSLYSDREAPAAPTDFEEEEEEGTPETPRGRVVFKQSPRTRLVVVGNAEFLSDLVARSLNSMEGGFFDQNLRFAKNLIDWVSLDDDMLTIRSHGVFARRLDRIDRRSEIVIETVNYLVPLLLLLGVGVYRYWRRKQVRPPGPLATARIAATPASRGEV